jgi:hypothetical protein
LKTTTDITLFAEAVKSNRVFVSAIKEPCVETIGMNNKIRFPAMALEV